MKKEFDAIAQSRKWRVATGKKLAEMNQQERLAYLNKSVSEKLQTLKAKPPRKRSRKTSLKQVAR